MTEQTHNERDKTIGIGVGLHPPLGAKCKHQQIVWQMLWASYSQLRMHGIMYIPHSF
uniref:Uncharacterized protein n=1 Tax=Nelumbo nucifera TaxID=4432 RepID=A0A822Y8L5_NELNU|nr:TPA_asm: hypothetical protein HUJ06_029379 [Nelumbo nucifera]